MFSRLCDLLDKTERNIKRIEALQGLFPAAVLNEWRYATRHVVTLVEPGAGDEERRKAEDHLARAYFDSCDILLDCLLERARVFADDYADRPEIPASTIENYPSVLRTIRDAHRAHSDVQGFSKEEKIEGYARLEGLIEPLWLAVDAIDAAAPTMAAARRKALRKDRMSFCVFVVAALTLVAAIMALAI